MGPAPHLPVRPAARRKRAALLAAERQQRQWALAPAAAAPGAAIGRTAADARRDARARGRAAAVAGAQRRGARATPARLQRVVRGLLRALKLQRARVGRCGAAAGGPQPVRQPPRTAASRPGRCRAWEAVQHCRGQTATDDEKICR